jgi:acyl-CoA ligase (AMP-forming) (exosortase A-associated)
MIPLDPVPRPLDRLPSMGGPAAVAIADREGVLDYAGLEHAVGALASWLLHAGLRAGDRVASWLPKTRTACLLPLAVPRAGLIHVPVNPLLKRAQVAHILADSGAAMLVTQAPRAATLEPGDIPAGCTVREEREAGDAVAAAIDVMPPSESAPDALAAILYTSGSTGRPKGVMLSHANLWLGAISVAHYAALTPDDVTLCVLPFSFDYGQNQLFSSWAAGARVVPLDYLTPRDVVKAVARHDVTTLAGVPPLWTSLVEAAWPDEVAARLRRVTNSGGALTPAMVERLRTRFPAAAIYPMYGLTEAFRSTYLQPSLVAAHPASMGRAIPFADVMVVRADGTKAAMGEPGELVHAGPLVAQGYWRDPARTAERFRPAPVWSATGGIAVWSGDTVMQDANGLFHFIGRADEMIKSSGNRISPTEIEEAVLRGGEAAQAVAYGRDDPVLGHAIIVAARAEGDVKAAEQALRDRLRAELPNFMQPHEYEWYDALPRNANGKFDRAAIRQGMRP